MDDGLGKDGFYEILLVVWKRGGIGELIWLNVVVDQGRRKIDLVG